MGWVVNIRVLGGLVTLALFAAACSGSDSLRGTALDPADPAPTFRLSDQFDKKVGLSDFVGDVVVLTFLYTSCPDVCPLTTETLRQAQRLLGDDASQVKFLAVSVDPERDTVGRAYQYSLEKGMLSKWHYLVGTREELAPVWSHYWLDPNRSVAGHEDASTGDESEGSAADGKPSGENADTDGYFVSHAAPVFLIDREGDRRVIFTDLSLDPSPLIHDIRLLLK